jgi:hypothetical protein
MPAKRITLLPSLLLATALFAAAQEPAPNAENGAPIEPLAPDTGDYFGSEPVSREVMRPLVPGEQEQAFVHERGQQDDPAQTGADAILAPIADPNLDEVPPLDDQGEGSGAGDQEAKRKLWRLVPVFAFGYAYDDNIYLRNLDRQGSGIININAGFAFELGDFREREGSYLLLNYVGTSLFYTEFESLNSYNPRFDIFAQYQSDPLTLQLESVFFYLNGVQRQLGEFTTQMLLANSVHAFHAYSEKTTLDLALNQRANIYPDNISSFYYELAAGFDYALTSKIKLGLEGVVGVAQADESPGMYYQIANTRFSYDVTGKIALRATGGVEFDEYSSGGEPIRLLPVFSLGGDYRPFGSTTFTVNCYRNIESSPALAQQDYVATGLEVGVRQGIGKKFNFGVKLGYENDTYIPNVRTVSSTRVDNYAFARPELTYDFLKYLKATLFCEYRTNDSTLQSDTWYDNRFGMEISASF